MITNDHMTFGLPGKEPHRLEKERLIEGYSSENLCISCGSCIRACQGYPPLIEMFGLPEGYIPHGTSLIGYPTEKYQRIPVRKPADVKWL